MWLTTVVALALGATGPLKLAVTEVKLSGLERSTGDLLETQLGSHLAKRAGLQVTSRQDVERLIGMERQRQLLGCASESSCVAELIGALGADGVVAASIGKLGGAYVVDVRVVGAREGKPLAMYSETVRSEEALLDAVRRAAEAIGDQLVAPAPVTARQLAWVPLVGGVLFAGAGAGALIAAESLAKTFSTAGTYQGTQAVQAAVNLGKLEQTLGAVGLGVGGAALVGGVLMLVLGAPPPVQASLQVGPSGAGFVVGGTW